MTQQQTVLSWLKDAHAVEVGALPTLTSHAAAAADYPEVQAKLLAFFEAFHVERKFEKRKRDRADPEALARRAHGARERRE